MQPRLGDGSAPRARRLARLRAFFTGSWRRCAVSAALLVWLLDRLLAAAGLALPAAIGISARVVLSLALLWLVWRGVRWLFDRFLWRIRTKLILSYLFIALVPVVLLGIFFTTAATFVLMLSASRLVRAQVERTEDLARATAASALVDLPAAGPAAAASLRERLAPVLALQPRTAWTLLRRGQLAAAEGGAPRELPAWWKGAQFAGLVPAGGPAGGGLRPAVLRIVSARGDATLLLDLPVDERLFADLERRVGIHVLQPEELTVEKALPHGRLQAQRDVVEFEGGGQRVRFSSPNRLAFVALLPRYDWRTGQAGADDFQPIVFRLAAVDYLRRLAPEMLGSWRSMSDAMLLVLGILGLVFLVMYGIALLLGLLLARSITFGVHALSLGTSRLRQGDFDYTIRVRSRDQLGELAESFNHMSRGLKQLMAEQAEKERLEEELRIAREIQMSLLPGQGLLKVRGIRVAALCLPAAEVGGDYYDLLPLGETRMGVLVADVSGKGTSAALYMAELKGLVLSLSRIYDSPARLLCEANRILSANMDSRSFVTMTYAVVDSAARCMRYARAGHSPMIQFEATSGRTRVLAPAGLGLGLDAGARFDRILEEVEVRLEPGDFFLFFTDGLSEAMSPGAELFGEGRLRRILERGGDPGSEELKERILEEVRGFVGDAAQHDDLTLVVLKVVEEELAA
ncbi:MAG: PP2C family protein-serine/threonine phosphatase [Betaproteobacteria bacterium]